MQTYNEMCIRDRYSAAQGLLAALAGAKYVAPYVNRVDAQGGDGIRTVQELSLIHI